MTSFPLDISRILRPGHPNWPGDAPLLVTPGLRIAQGDSVNTGVLSTSTHTGTHVDAPWHYDDEGARLEDVPLAVYVGPCWVLGVQGTGEPRLVNAEALAGLPEDVPPRVLLRTGQVAEWLEFPLDFTALSPAFVQGLAARGVRLLGTDSPSVDPLESTALPAHHACRDAGLFILEGLNLSGVPDGPYDLVCLPLPLAEVDGAPARAILLPPGTLSAVTG